MTILQTAPASSNETQTIRTKSDTSYPYLVGNDSRLEELIAVLRTTKLGKELLDDAEKYGTKITTAALSSAHGAYDDESNVVMLGSGGSFDRQITTLAHELRHAQQFKNGVQLNALTDVPKDYLHSQWTIEADANVASCLVAWDLKQQGNPGPMQAFAQENGHITKPFEAAAEKGGIENNLAQKEAFRAWFTDMGIRDAYESNYLRNFDRRKRKASRAELDTALQRSVPVTENVAKVCRTNGTPYLTEKETKDFFDRPEMSSVKHETFWAIYRNLRDVKHFDFLSDAKEIMKKEGNFSIRESAYYEIRRPSLERRQAQAAAKIAEHKEKHSVTALNAILAAKQKNMSEK